MLSAQMSKGSSVIPGMVMCIAFLKIYLVMYVFMELDNAPTLWRRLFQGWTMATLMLLLVLQS